MRLVFPTNENIGYLSKRDAHFGKAKFYTIIDLEKDNIVDVEVVENEGHANVCTDAIKNIMALNPDALIVKGIGAKPAEGFFKAGLDVYFDNKSPKIEDSLKMFMQGKLAKLETKGTCSVH